MKVLLLTNEYPPHVYGGAGVHVAYLTRELAKLIDVDVRCFGEQDYTAASLRVKGYGVDAQRFAATDSRLRSPLEALDRCVSFAAAPIDADVVHCHTWYSYFAGVIVKMAYGLPLVVTTHSLEPSRSWKREQLGRGYDLSSWIERTALQTADHVIAVSTSMQQDIVRLFGVAPERVTAIYNGIDTEEYRPVSTHDALAKYGVDRGLPYVLFVGRITRQKGILHLIRAIDYLDAGIQVVLCAGAPDTADIGCEMTAAVQQAQTRRSHVVWIAEMVDQRAVVELYSHAAVFCCPSIYEPFGIINLEAMACCVPVVASAVGGITEVVVANETGLLVPIDQDDIGEPKDADRFARDLAGAINLLMSDPALRRRMGVAGRQRAIDVFGWPVVARDVLDIYESVAQRALHRG